MTELRRLSVGNMSVLHQPGLIRRLEVGGVEVIRMISAPVRDANWGTCPAKTLANDLVETEDSIRIEERFSVADDCLEGHLVFDLRAEGRASAELALAARRDVKTNRAGFTVLHPIQRTVGTDLTVSHPDGSATRTRFPEGIAPGQPALDVVGLAHRIAGVAVDIAFHGEVFEMEDQRNWSDASFKTYCRPLSLPVPYTIAEGQTVRQRIEIRLEREDTNATSAPMTGRRRTVRLPTLCLAVEPDWLGGPLPQTLRPILRFATPNAWAEAALNQIAATHREIDVEIVAPDGEDVATVLDVIKARLETAGLNVAHIIALPEAYLASYQPLGPWPDGASPEDCAAAAQEAFPEAHIGVGMLTHFTELNRRPSEPSLGDYVTFGNTAIVHAADDLSVWETLETLPHIFRSAAALSGGRPIRLGLVSIGMRSNPYGNELAPNAGLARVPMAGQDPRQTKPFAAAYAVATYALAAEAGVRAIALGAPAGRFGLVDDDGAPRPIHDAVMALADLGDEAELVSEDNQFRLSGNGRTITAVARGCGAVKHAVFGRRDG